MIPQSPLATVEPPPLRVQPPAPRHPNELGPPELPVPEGPEGAARRQPFDWMLVGITAAFLAGAGAIFAGGYYVHKGDSLAAGETKVIADRPDLTIPDNGTAAITTLSPAVQSAGTAANPAVVPVASSSSSSSGTSNTPAGVPYNMNAPAAQGGTVGNRPNAKVVPGQQGPIDPNKLFMPPPGQLKAPPGVKPVH